MHSFTPVEWFQLSWMLGGMQKFLMDQNENRFTFGMSKTDELKLLRRFDFQLRQLTLCWKRSDVGLRSGVYGTIDTSAHASQTLWPANRVPRFINRKACATHRRQNGRASQATTRRVQCWAIPLLMAEKKREAKAVLASGIRMNGTPRNMKKIAFSHFPSLN